MAGASVGVPGFLAAAGIDDWRILALCAVLTPLASRMAQLSWQRWGHALQRREDQAATLADGCIAGPDGQLPRVRDVVNPIWLGVHPASRWHGGAGVQRAHERVPWYVPRDIDGELRRRLVPGAFVVLIGDSTAGKSRAAYEAMRAMVPDHLLLAPASRDTLPVALTRMAHERRCLLWLDSIERFLGPGGLTRAGVARVMGGHGHHRIILATLRAAEMARYVDDTVASDDTRRQVAFEVREALEQADLVTLGRLFTSAERRRSEAYTGDPRIADALAHADTYGLAEYLAAGPGLLQIWEAAWEPGNFPRGAALVAAAVDCRRAGLTRPVPRVLLENLHLDYLHRHGGQLLRPERLDRAWAWATQSRYATVALLGQTAESGYVVFDYLVDSVQRRRNADNLIPSRTLVRVLAHADAAEAETVGWTAHRQGQHEIAYQAFSQAFKALAASRGAEHPASLVSRRCIAYSLYALGRWREAESEFRDVTRISERTLGARHMQTLLSRVNLGHLLADSGNLPEAEWHLRRVLEISDADSDLNLSARSGLAIAYFNAGRYADAEAEARKVVGDTSSARGADHLDTLKERCYYALILERLDRLEEAAAEQRDVLAALVHSVGPEHHVTLQSRDNIAEILRKLRRLEEAEAEYRAILEIRNRVLGAEHPATILGYACLAAVRAELGWLAAAELDYRFLAGVFSRTFGPEHSRTLSVRTELADVLWKRNMLAEAQTEYSAVLKIQQRVLGQANPTTLITRRSLERLLAGHAPP